jgi:hypothetical protein
MTVEKLRWLRRAEAFRPFTIRLADGRGIRVSSPEYFGVSPRGGTVIVHEADDTLDLLDPLQITGLEIQAPGRGPGKRPKA